MSEPWSPTKERDKIYITHDGGELRTIAVNPAIPPSMARQGLWRVEDFDLHKELYRGKTSLVYMATDKQSGIQVALKLYRKRKLSTMNRYQVEREMRIHIQLDHVNIIKLYAAFEDDKNVYMVQEFAGGGDLFEDLKKHGGQIKEKYVIRDVIVPFLSALQYLHDKGIIHRDIKPENILLTSQKIIKIADFGLSIDVHLERPVTRAGTLDYMSPEVLVCPDKRRPEENKDKVLLAYTSKVDAWAVGILAYELLVGYPPFEQESRAATYEHIMYKDPYFSSCLSPEAKAFIAFSLVKNATQRPSVSELAAHPWVQPYVKKLEEDRDTLESMGGVQREMSTLGGPMRQKSVTAMNEARQQAVTREKKMSSGTSADKNVVVDEDASYDISAFDYDAAASLYGIPSSSKSFSSKQKRVSSNLRPKPSGGREPSSDLHSAAANVYYKPQMGVLSDDAQLPTPRSKSMSISSNAMVQNALRQSGVRPPSSTNIPSASATSTAAKQQSSADRLAELAIEEDSSKNKGGSKYSSLFAKMWGGDRSSGNKSSAREDSARAQISTPSKSSSSRKGQLQTLQEEVLHGRESSVMVTREGSVIGAPTMKFKQPNREVLQQLRSVAEGGEHLSKGGVSFGPEPTKAKLGLQDEVGGGRMGSEAVMQRPVVDYSMGRSFTTANGPAVRKYANAPIVNKIEEYVQRSGN
uniref:Protein kinase domain-containing protein n=1 Tax=Dunaliella tertiolecta TaxID=3047 RepID=A0A7S3VNV4_DUNTE|mmetsp:Transcript_28531/g.76968  ORF Transcript_28531/g.76968 Transcript_28531/m.76968 type:complete len:694 (-) Transcript_28531:371-2452(-)